MNTLLDIRKLAFAYDKHPVLTDINLQLNSGQIGCLLGPSGCGKSTLLRLIAGFEQPGSGQICIDQVCVADSSQMVMPQQRQVGMLFQDLALFPHLSVRDNIAFGLQETNSAERQRRTDQLIELCRLEGLAARHPHQLSGGQCQRVALARAMAPKPKLILLDEPFSSVDRELQSELVQEVKSLLRADDSTALWVTHSLDEALAVADQTGIMLGGQLLQWSPPEQLYEQPEHPAVIGFLNHANLLGGTIEASGQLSTALGLLSLTNATQFAPGDAVVTAIDKQQLQLSDSGTDPVITIRQCVYRGGHYLISAELSTGETMQLFHHQARQPGEQAHIRLTGQTPSQGFHHTP